MSPIAAPLSFATRSPAGTDSRRSATVADVVRRAGFGACHPSDDVANCPDVVVEIGARADDGCALVSDLLQALGGHRLQSSTNDGEPFQQVVEVLGAKREETAVRRCPHAGHSSPPGQQADLWSHTSQCETDLTVSKT